MKSDRKSQIIQTAAKLFREHGYNSVSMRDLADKLGIKAASLYNHIKSKEEILAEIIMDLAFDFTKHIDAVEQKEISIIDKLKEIIQMHVQTTIYKTDSLACMNKEWKHLGEEKQEIFLELRGKYEAKFLQMIKRGIEKGELDMKNAEITVFSILSTLRTLYHWYSNQSVIKEQELINTLQHNLLFGIVAVETAHKINLK
ncbi:MAG TPA: TetR/AcrR family transcriptional regulator [Flavobacteriaceae bacterium]|nr:TetR/AcrR family transcriptional regulator [Flavobacteriaceae bacterium]